jgi:hypothetical protein
MRLPVCMHVGRSREQKGNVSPSRAADFLPIPTVPYKDFFPFPKPEFLSVNVKLPSDQNFEQDDTVRKPSSIYIWTSGPAACWFLFFGGMMRMRMEKLLRAGEAVPLPCQCLFFYRVSRTIQSFLHLSLLVRQNLTEESKIHVHALVRLPA